MKTIWSCAWGLCAPGDPDCIHNPAYLDEPCLDDPRGCDGCREHPNGDD